jgi:uncharacterized oxidoreductase
LANAPKTDSATYCATKAALNSLNYSLSYQLPELKVQQALLPLVDTPMTHGRGTNKLSASEAARQIIAGLSTGRHKVHIGKANLLAWIYRFSPNIARNIMRSYNG